MALHVVNVAATMDAEGGARRGEWVERGCAQAKMDYAQAEMGYVQAERGYAQTERGYAQAERERDGTALNWAGAEMVAG